MNGGLEWTLNELEGQPIVVKLYDGPSDEYIAAVFEDANRKKFKTSSIEGIVELALENYERSPDSSTIAMYIKTRMEQLGERVGYFIDGGDYEGALLTENDRFNPINNRRYLRKSTYQGRECLLAEIRIGDPHEFEGGYN